MQAHRAADRMKQAVTDSVQTEREDNQEPTGATLASSVYDQLRRDILSGDLSPGTKLRADYLRARYSVGNSPVREALNRLSSDGLVIREDQKGFRVSEVSREDLLELLKTRLWLEEIALRESIANGGVEWEERLVLSFHRLSKLPRSLSQTEYVVNPEWEQRHREFHMALIAACGSRFLVMFCEQLNDRADRYRQLAVATSYPKRKELDEHKIIFEAAVAGDADAAVEHLGVHYRKTVDIILGSGVSYLTAQAAEAMAS